MRLPRFLCRRRYITYRGELSEIARTIASGHIDEGDHVARFEATLAEYHGGGEVSTVSSGRVGLLVLLEALGLRPGDEILVPALTLRALVELLEQVGYVPVPVDVDGGGINMDPAAAATRVGPQTRAILATHMFGEPCAIEELAALAAERELLLVEDCAQALGSEVQGQKVGTFGDGAIFSFDLLKPINTFGGGAVLTFRPEVAARVRERVQSFAPAGSAMVKRIAAGYAEHAALVGPTAPLVAAALASDLTRAIITRSYRNMQSSVRPSDKRFSNLQAAIGNRLLDSLDARVAVRRSMARRLGQLVDDERKPHGGRRGNGYFFVRFARDAEVLRKKLLWRGIDAGIGHEVADFCGDLGRAAECPKARTAFERAIQLPLHEGLEDPDLDRIAAACRGRVHPRL